MASSPAAAAGLTTPTEKAIAANWTEFFNLKAGLAKRVALLQDVSALSSALNGMATDPQAQSSSAKVDSITVFCALLALETGGSTSKLPAACESAS
ncbi:MAG TPA: hypothetical protein VF060_27540 [Trebonia sp.]